MIFFLIDYLQAFKGRNCVPAAAELIPTIKTFAHTEILYITRS